MQQAVPAAPRQPWLGPLLAAYVRLLRATCRWRIADGTAGASGPAILCFWHGDMLLLGPLAARFPGAHALVSRSRDGAMAATALDTLGHRAIRASRARPGKPGKGGLEGLAEIAALLRSGGVVALAADGPRGPARRCAPGLARLAQATGAPLVCIGAAAAPAFRAGSWDAMLLPPPFARAALALSAPAQLTRSLSASAATAAVEEALERTHAEALALLRRA